MTAALALPAPVTTGAARVWSVARIQTVAWPLLIAWPAGILATAFAIPWVIFALVTTDQQYNVTGSVLSLYGFVVAFYLLSMTQMFPFSLRLGSTRAHFMSSIVLIGLVQSFVFAAVLQALSVVEEATDGWGVRMRMFGVLRFLTDSALIQFTGYFATLTLVVGLSVLAGVIHHRWRAMGLLTAGTAIIVAGGLASILLTWTQSWSCLWSWFADTPRVVTLVLLPIAIAAVCTATAWRILHRSAP
ncbi:hypothetical protein EV641_101389 [Rhodococcus sp. SMB37]|uniref:hypothetical protein n=1 Tax=Rhodococcus sp. SMB37 TaxID=2512213 RepID=UPI00104B0FBF|nr:hypothetical protein [Rhodococcus sp. SMB37]TCN58286.1 hypothetical protein EV641_101389 [Rhodococcus sp. SMB37]